MIGKLVNVTTRVIGSALSKDHLAGIYVIYVADVSDFWDSDTLMIGAEVIKYNVTVDEDISDDEDGLDIGSTCYLELESPLENDYDEDTDVYVHPLQNVRFGTVLIGSTAIVCPIDTRLWACLQDGIREN